MSEQKVAKNSLPPLFGRLVWCSSGFGKQKAFDCRKLLKERVARPISKDEQCSHDEEQVNELAKKIARKVAVYETEAGNEKKCIIHTEVCLGILVVSLVLELLNIL
jgi:hypothetical protein